MQAVSRILQPVPRVRVAAAQLDLVVGDLDGNVDRMLDAYERADAAGCDLVAFPELSLTGYPPEDLLLRPSFVAHCAESLEKFAARTGRTAAVVGFPEVQRDLANAAALCAHGRVQGVYRKHLLPNYAVFDEQRYFAASTVDGPLFVVAGVRVGLTICEDAWSPNGPIITQAAGGAELVVNINASPYYAGRIHEREAMLATRAADASVPVLYVNLVGGQDELVFDGASMLFDETGRLVARARQFDEDLLVVDVDVRPAFRRRLLDPRAVAHGARCPRSRCSEARLGEHHEEPRVEPLLPPVQEVYEALVLGTRDYVRKNGFTDVLDRPLRGHRLVAGRGDRGRRARARAGRRRAHAVALLERRQRHRRRAARRQPRHPHGHRADRSRAHRVPRHARTDLRGHSSRASPRRTCRPASAAPSS